VGEDQKDMQTEKKEQIFLSLGSNLGDREANLKLVLSELPPEVEVIKESSIYQTEPWGFMDQPDFLNQVLSVKTALAPHDLLIYVKNIELKIGREPSFRFGPRLVDIDILFYSQEIIEDETLDIPHPRICERAFVLIPLMEIAPDLIYPGTDRKVSDFLKDVDGFVVNPYEV